MVLAWYVSCTYLIEVYMDPTDILLLGAQGL